MFCEGVAIESICWPGKAWADLHRASALSEGTMARRAAALGLFRLGGGVGGLLIAAVACAVSLGAGWLPVIVGGAATLCMIAAVVAKKHRTSDGTTSTKNWSWRVTRLIAWGALASACDMAAMTLLAAKVGQVSVTWFVGVYAVTSVVAALSMLPLGLGVLDLGCWHVLTTYAGLDPAAATTVLLLYRLTGPLFTASIGAALLLLRLAADGGWIVAFGQTNRTSKLGGEL